MMNSILMKADPGEGMPSPYSCERWVEEKRQGPDGAEPRGLSGHRVGRPRHQRVCQVQVLLV